MMTTDASNATTDAGGKAISLVRRLVVINLGFVTLQALSAGFLMSGYARPARRPRFVSDRQNVTRLPVSSGHVTNRGPVSSFL